MSIEYSRVASTREYSSTRGSPTAGDDIAARVTEVHSTLLVLLFRSAGISVIQLPFVVAYPVCSNRSRNLLHRTVFQIVQMRVFRGGRCVASLWFASQKFFRSGQIGSSQHHSSHWRSVSVLVVGLYCVLLAYVHIVFLHTVYSSLSSSTLDMWP